MDALWTTPVPSTAFIEPVELKRQPGRLCSLSFKYDSDGPGYETCELRFLDVESFKCTYLWGCTQEMRSAYDAIVDAGNSPWLHKIKQQYVERGKSDPGLRHLRIFFDDGPCCEILCARFEAIGCVTPLWFGK